jgi:glutaredoxin-related protein
MEFSNSKREKIVEEIEDLKQIHQIYIKNEVLGSNNRIEHMMDIMIRIAELQKLLDEELF